MSNTLQMRSGTVKIEEKCKMRNVNNKNIYLPFSLFLYVHSFRSILAEFFFSGIRDTWLTRWHSAYIESGGTGRES